MRKNKIVFFDIDGTLLNETKELPKSSKEAVLALQDSGVQVAIATGRAPFMFEELRDELNIDTYVSFNGQFVVHQGEVVYKSALKEEMLTAISAEAMANGHPLVYMNEAKMVANVEDHPFISESLGTLKFEHPPKDASFYLGKEIHQALLFCKEADDASYVAHYPHFQFIRWHPYSTDILPKVGSKAVGIQKILEKLGLSRQDAYAFGDGLNDIEMMNYVGCGVAMGNARDEVIEAADLVTKHVDEDGVLFGLQKIGLI